MITISGDLWQAIQSEIMMQNQQLEEKLMSGMFQTLRSRINNVDNYFLQVENDSNRFCRDLAKRVNQTENLLNQHHQQYTGLETEILKYNEEMKEIKEFLTNNNFQAAGSEKLRLDSLAQLEHPAEEGIVTLEEVLPNNNMNTADIKCVNKEISSGQSDKTLDVDISTLKKLINEVLKEGLPKNDFDPIYQYIMSLMNQPSTNKPQVLPSTICDAPQQTHKNCAEIEKEDILLELKNYCSDLSKPFVSEMSGKFNSMSSAIQDLQVKVSQIEKNFKNSPHDNNESENPFSIPMAQLAGLSSSENQDLCLEHEGHEGRPPQPNQLQTEYYTPIRAPPIKIAFLYNDQKLNTENVLQKLGSDVISNKSNLETDYAYVERGIITPMINQPNIIFFFYFTTNGREQIQEIEARLDTISTTFPNVPIYLLLLKDEKCRNWPIDKSKLDTLQVTKDCFTIYSAKYGEFTLSPGDFTKPTLKHKYAEVDQNYDNLWLAVQTIL